MIDHSAAATGLASPPASRVIPLWERSLAWQAGAVILGTLFLALSSYVTVPMLPVPMTMQTFAVTLVGALMGWRLGGLTILAWLAEGALGLPVLSNGASGLTHFMGPTGGYLLAFPVAGMLVGWLAQRGWNGRRVGLAFAAMLLGNATCLLVGAAWLSTLIGIEKAMMVGVVPFLAGAVVKSALGAATLKALARR
jgi:biotin transport system substrate-specific component